MPKYNTSRKRQNSRNNRPMRYKKLSNLTRGKIIAYFEDGKSQRQIAKIVRTSRSTIQNIINTYKKSNDIKRLSGSGSKRKTSKRDDKIIVKISKNDPFMSSKQISVAAKSDYNIDISRQTVDRRLDEAGLKSYIAKKKPFISDNNTAKRLQWCIDHQNWTVDQWKRVLWCDETSFTLSYHGRQYVRRPKDARYDKKYLRPTFKHGGGKINVFGCFSANGVGDLYKIDGNMVCICYVHFIQIFF